MVVLNDEICDDTSNFGGELIKDIFAKDIIYMSKPLDAERFVSMVKSLHFSLLTQLVSTST